VPSIDIALPPTTPEVRGRLARDLTKAFCGATGFEPALLDIFFHHYEFGHASRNGELIHGGGELAVHIHIACPRISRLAKQAIATEVTGAFRSATGWQTFPVIHITEHPYDNVVVDGQLLSDAFEACRRRRFYYPLDDN
jgi:phenylpyruvate tautomerase PptA (4-oxalocrotonate tautomerase family)